MTITFVRAFYIFIVKIFIRYPMRSTYVNRKVSSVCKFFIANIACMK